MRQTLLLILGMFLFTFSSAQEEGVEDQKLRLGLQVSPFLSWLASGDNSIAGAGTNFGFKLGPVGEYYFRENYAFIGGINLAFNMGGTVTHANGGDIWPKTSQTSDTPGLDAIPAGSDLGFKIQAVEIPFGVKFRTNQFGYSRYFVEIPFILGIKTQARGSVSGAGLETKKENIGKDTQGFNISWGIGGGTEYEISESLSFLGAVTFQGGFIDQTQDPNTEDAKVVINVINFKIAAMF